MSPSCFTSLSSVSVFYCYADHPVLPSFPTRRSSDLSRSPSESTWPTSGRLNSGGGSVPLRSSSRTLLPESVTCDSASDRKSTRLNSSHTVISYAVFCLKKKKKDEQ